MKKIIIVNKIVFFFKYCLYFNLESKSTLNYLFAHKKWKLKNGLRLPTLLYPLLDFNGNYFE